MVKTILVLIPAYNAGLTILGLIERTSKFVDRCDIVVVDDGSEDQTMAIAQRTGVVVLKHEGNKGKGEALKTGFSYALRKNYQSVITIDADLQHDPESIPEFIRISISYPGILIGTRTMELKIMPFTRWLTNKLTSLILSVLSGKSIRDSQSGFRLIPIQAVKNFKLESKRYDLESEILIKAGRNGLNIEEVPIRTIYREGKSFIHPLFDTSRFIKLMWRSLWW